MRFPEAVHLQQRRVVELRQQLGLVDEAAQAGREGLGVARRAHRDRHRLRARGQRAGHVLLDRDAAVQCQIVREVDDAEAALADHRDDLELVQPRGGGQRVGELAGQARARHTTGVRSALDDGALVVGGRRHGGGANRRMPSWLQAKRCRHQAGAEPDPHSTPAPPRACMTLVHCGPAGPHPRSRMVPPFSAQLVFAVLGPLFLIAGAWRCLGADRRVVQGRTWLIVGAIFSAVALYLWWSQPATP